MPINIELIEKQDCSKFYKYIEKLQLQLWNRIDILDKTQQDYILVIVREEENKITGWWLVPIVRNEDSTISAQRKFRYFPYSSPWLYYKSHLKVRQVFGQMILELQKRVDVIDLPLAPMFVDVNTAVAKGCFAEWRHTHLISFDAWELKGHKMFSSKVNSDIRFAEKNVDIKFSEVDTDFNYLKAIRGSPDSVTERSKLARQFMKHKIGTTIIARCNKTNNIVGGALLVEDRGVVLLMHSWYEKNSSRGISSLIIRESITHSFQNAKACKFDFEGSILSTVDRFMSGFGAEIVPYPYIYWSKDTKKILGMVENSLNIDGRVEV